jgi:hypothetical protein
MCSDALLFINNQISNLMSLFGLTKYLFFKW